MQVLPAARHKVAAPEGAEALPAWDRAGFVVVVPPAILEVAVAALPPVEYPRSDLLEFVQVMALPVFHFPVFLCSCSLPFIKIIRLL